MNNSSADKHPIPKNYLAEPNRARSHAVWTASFTPVRHQVISRMATSSSWRPACRHTRLRVRSCCPTMQFPLKATVA